MKNCSMCQQEKPLSDFNKNLSKKDGLQTKCKDCSQERGRAYYNRNKDKFLRYGREAKERIRAKINELKTNPCVDCGGRFPPCAMDFDHRDGGGKIGSISNLVNKRSWGLIEKEISKCDLVCANCHRVRTQNRRAGYPLKKSPKLFP